MHKAITIVTVNQVGDYALIEVTAECTTSALKDFDRLTCTWSAVAAFDGTQADWSGRIV